MQQVKIVSLIYLICVCIGNSDARGYEVVLTVVNVLLHIHA